MKIGLQLYSVRDEMEKDMEGTLRAVKEMGYDYVEFAGYFGHTAEEVRTLLDKYGLKCLSVHQSYDVYFEDFAKWLNVLKTLGAKYTAIPWMDVSCHLGGKNCERATEEIRRLGEKLAANGIELLYHNHEFEYEHFNGKLLMDAFYEALPKSVINPELDVCWITYGGSLPEDEIRKYSDRVTIIHLKDFTAKRLNAGAAYALIGDDGALSDKKPTRADNDFRFVPLGAGRVNLDAVFEASEEIGAEMFIVEQDQPSEGKTSLECAQISREFLRAKGY